MWQSLHQTLQCYEGYPEGTLAHTVRTPVLLQPITGFWCSVWRWKLPHAVVCRTLSPGRCRESCGHGCADCEVRGVTRFLQADEILGYLAEKTSSSGIVLLYDNARTNTARQTQALLREHSTGTSSSIHRTVRTWHRQIFSRFQKWWSTLLVNASQMMKTWRKLVE